MRLARALAVLVIVIFPMAAIACEQEVVLSQHLEPGDARDFYVIEIKRAHGANMIGTIMRSFGGTLAAGRTVSIQFVEDTLADATCPLEFAPGGTYLFKARLAGGALQVSRFNSHNIPATHERFATYIKDIESKTTTR